MPTQDWRVHSTHEIDYPLRAFYSLGVIIIIIIIITIIIIIAIIYYYFIIIELTCSKTILENTVEIEPQPVALDFKNLSQYSSRSK